MGNPFKKKLNRLMGKSNKSAGWQRGQLLHNQNVGSTNARTAELDAAMKEYENVPTTIRQQYSDAAKRAGTYGNTAEFEAGLNSEVLAGSRGARVGIAGRINALKKALGHTDEFKPEGFGETQANMTQDTLTQNPSQDPTGAATTPEAASAPQEAPSAAAAEPDESGKTAVSSVQTPRAKALKTYRKI